MADHNRLKIMSEAALFLANTDRPQQVEDYVRACTTSSEYWPTSTSWRLCQSLQYFYQMMTDLKEVEDYVRGCTTSTKYWRFQQVEDYLSGCTTASEYWPTSTGWRLWQRLHYFQQILTDLNRLNIMSEVALLLPNTDLPQQFEDYVRGCTTSSEHCLTSTGWRLCQRLHYF